MSSLENLLSEIAEQVENGDLPDATKGISRMKQFIRFNKTSFKLASADYKQPLGEEIGGVVGDKNGKFLESSDTDFMDQSASLVGTRTGGKSSAVQKLKKRYMAPVDEGMYTLIIASDQTLHLFIKLHSPINTHPRRYINLQANQQFFLSNYIQSTK